MPSRRQLAVPMGYAAASAVYVAIGVWFTDFLFSFFVALVYLRPRVVGPAIPRRVVLRLAGSGRVQALLVELRAE